MFPAPYKQKETKYFCRFTFNQFFTLLVLEIFTLFFIFYLGARYGRELFGFSSKIVQAPREEFPDLKPANPKLVAATQDPEIQEMAKDILNAAPNADLKQRVADLLQESRSPEGTKPPIEPKRVALRPAPQKAKSNPVIQTNPFHAKYSIQVGSYQNVEEAHDKVAFWKSKGYPSYLVSADIPGKGQWYRVRLGGFPTKEEAKAYLDDLVEAEQVDAFIAPTE